MTRLSNRPAFAALAHPRFARFASGKLLMTLASQMLGVGVGYQVWQLTRDPLAVGLVGLAQFLPFVFMVLPAGQLADRVDRRAMLAVAYALDLIAALILLVFTLSGATAIWVVYFAMVLLGAGRALSMPAGQAIVPNLVPPHLFAGAVSVNSVFYQIGVIAGPSFGGVIAIGGVQWVYATAAVLLAVSTALIISMRAVRAPAPEGASWSLRDALEGLRFVLSRKPLLGAISLDLFAVLFGGVTALLPIFASEILQVGPAGLGALRTAPAVGAAVVALWLGFKPITRNAGTWMFGGVAVFGIATLAFGLSTSFILSLAALIFLGAGDMVSVFVRNLLVQLETPDGIRGRVSAINAMFIGASNELGEFESGVTASWWGVVPATLVGGCATLVVVGAYLWLFPGLRKLDRFPEPARE
jgi:MFS family permease